MALVNKEEPSKRPLKRSKTGLEVEFHLVDEKGRIANRGLEVIEAVRNIDARVPIVKECGKNMIELGCYPGIETFSPALDLIDSVEVVYDVARKMGLYLYPFATYPAEFVPEFSEGGTYNVKEKIFGLERFQIAPRCVGFHHHYTLPKGVFDMEAKELKLMRRSKLTRSMINSYNFEIAIDPVLTLFTQSSPFYQGVYLAKDSRMLAYRGGGKLGYAKGLYAKLQQIGGLPPYKQTVTDLVHSLKRRQLRWKKVIKKADSRADFDELYPVKLDIGWHPVKINKHGTLEQRGMDMNYLSILLAVTVLLKFCLKRIQRTFIEVIPADFGAEEAFKIEGGIMYVPPQTYVRNKLQVWSAYKGYGQKEMYDYAKRFFGLAKSIAPKRYGKVIRPLSEMMERKESVSDKIMKYAKWKGLSEGQRIGKKESGELALHYAETFYKDLMLVKGFLNQIKGL